MAENEQQWSVAGPATVALSRLKRTIRDMVACASEKERVDVSNDLFALEMELLKYEPPILRHPDGPM